MGYTHYPALLSNFNHQHLVVIVSIVSYSRGGACPTGRGSTPYRGTPLKYIDV